MCAFAHPESSRRRDGDRLIAGRRRRARRLAVRGARSRDRRRGVAGDGDVAHEAPDFVRVGRHVGPTAAEVDARWRTRDDRFAHRAQMIVRPAAARQFRDPRTRASPNSPTGMRVATVSPLMLDFTNYLGDCKFILVSNREPYEHVHGVDGSRSETTCRRSGERARSNDASDARHLGRVGFRHRPTAKSPTRWDGRRSARRGVATRCAACGSTRPT